MVQSESQFVNSRSVFWWLANSAGAGFGGWQVVLGLM
jgi:hypothetical protein